MNAFAKLLCRSVDPYSRKHDPPLFRKGLSGDEVPVAAGWPENQTLQPKPPKTVRANIDYHVEIDRHYYSVPYQLAGQQLEARYTATTIELFQDGKRVARPQFRGLPAYDRSRAHVQEPVGPASGGVVVKEVSPLPLFRC